MSGIPNWAMRGRRVVCIDDSPRFMSPRFMGTSWGKSERIVAGEIYTIASAWIDRDGNAVVDLVERHRDQRARREWGDDVGYWVGRFRPLVEDSDENGIEARIFRQKGLHSKPSKREVADA